MEKLNATPARRIFLCPIYFYSKGAMSIFVILHGVVMLSLNGQEMFSNNRAIDKGWFSSHKELIRSKFKLKQIHWQIVRLFSPCKLFISDLRFFISDLRFFISNLRSQILDLKSKISDFLSRIILPMTRSRAHEPAKSKEDKVAWSGEFKIQIYKYFLIHYTIG